MNLKDIRLLTRQNLAQENINASFFQDSDINTYINLGVKEACTKGKVYLEHGGLLIQPSTLTYLLPWQTLSIKSLTRDDGTPIPMFDVTQKGMFYAFSTTTPSGYYLSSVAESIATWQTNQSYTPWLTSPSLTSYVLPPTANGYFYECLNVGTSGPMTPTFNTVVGDFTTDNNITWGTREMVGGLWQLTLNVSPTYIVVPTLYDLWYQAMDYPLAQDYTSPRFPPELHRCLVSYATYKCAEMMRQKPVAVAYLTEFTNILGLSTPSVGS